MRGVIGAVVLGLAAAGAAWAEGPPRFAGRVSSTADLTPAPGVWVETGAAAGVAAEAEGATLAPARFDADGGGEGEGGRRWRDGPPRRDPYYWGEASGFWRSDGRLGALAELGLAAGAADVLLRRSEGGPFVYRPGTAGLGGSLVGIGETTLIVSGGRGGRGGWRRAYRAGFRDGLRADRPGGRPHR